MQRAGDWGSETDVAAQHPTDSEPGMTDTAPVVLCDAIQSLAVHNGVARLTLTRLAADGRAAPALELLLPLPVISQIVEALKSVES